LTISGGCRKRESDLCWPGAALPQLHYLR
jgi:hypothetical protein